MSQNRSVPPQDDFARALLRSAEGDEPSNAAYAKVAAALGVSTAVGVGASLPAPAALAAAGSSSLARWSGSLSGKLALLGVSGALLIGGGGALLRHGFAGGAAGARVALRGGLPVQAPAAAESGAAASKLASAAALRTPPGALVAPMASEAAAAANDTTRALAQNAGNLAEPMDADAEAAAMVRPARAALRAAVNSSASHASAVSASSGSSLPEQVQSLDRARVALGSGDPAAALAEIARYRKAWPQGVFLTEASVLEIEALAKRGERSLAAARAQAFVTAHPDSPQAERLRALIPAPASEQP